MKKNNNQYSCLIFSTSIQDRHCLYRVSRLMDNWTEIRKWSVDMEDWQKVLKVEGENLKPDIIKTNLRKLNIQSQQLPIW